MSDEIELVDLDVIARWSVALSTATAPRVELIETLRGDLEWLESLEPLDDDDPPQPGATDDAATPASSAPTATP